MFVRMNKIWLRLCIHPFHIYFLSRLLAFKHAQFSQIRFMGSMRNDVISCIYNRPHLMVYFPIETLLQCSNCVVRFIYNIRPLRYCLATHFKTYIGSKIAYTQYTHKLSGRLSLYIYFELVESEDLWVCLFIKQVSVKTSDAQFKTSGGICWL